MQLFANLPTLHDGVANSEDCRLHCCADLLCEWYEFFSMAYNGTVAPVGRCNLFSRTEALVVNAAAISGDRTNCTCYVDSVQPDMEYLGADLGPPVSWVKGGFDLFRGSIF